MNMTIEIEQKPKVQVRLTFGPVEATNSRQITNNWYLVQLTFMAMRSHQFGDGGRGSINFLAGMSPSKDNKERRH